MKISRYESLFQRDSTLVGTLQQKSGTLESATLDEGTECAVTPENYKL